MKLFLNKSKQMSVVGSLSPCCGIWWIKNEMKGWTLPFSSSTLQRGEAKVVVSCNVSLVWNQHMGILHHRSVCGVDNRLLVFYTGTFP